MRFVIASLMLALAACGGDGPVKCSKESAYLRATASARVDVPEDLDKLDELREMPVPEPSPQVPDRAPGGCLTDPPVILGQ